MEATAAWFHINGLEPSLPDSWGRTFLQIKDLIAKQDVARNGSMFCSVDFIRDGEIFISVAFGDKNYTTIAMIRQGKRSDRV